MFPEKGVPSAVVWTVRRWCPDCVVGLKESSTGGLLRLQKFCHRSCWVFVATRKLKRPLTAVRVEYCQKQDSSHLPSREAPAQTATGEPGMPLWTWCALGWVASAVRVMLAWYDYGVVCQWSVVLWHSAQTATYTVECLADCVGMLAPKFIYALGFVMSQHCLGFLVFSEREPYLGGCKFPQFFYGIWYPGHPLTSTWNFTEIISGKPLRQGS